MQLSDFSSGARDEVFRLLPLGRDEAFRLFLIWGIIPIGGPMKKAGKYSKINLCL